MAQNLGFHRCTLEFEQQNRKGPWTLGPTNMGISINEVNKRKKKTYVPLWFFSSRKRNDFSILLICWLFDFWFFSDFSNLKTCIYILFDFSIFSFFFSNPKTFMLVSGPGKKIDRVGKRRILPAKIGSQVTERELEPYWGMAGVRQLGRCCSSVVSVGLP